MNNAQYGKNIESVRGRINLHIGDEDALTKLAGKPTFKNATPLVYDSDGNAETFVIENGKEVARLDRPSYGGLVILDYSKLIMSRFYYEYLVPKFGSRMSLAYCDTDSFLLHIQSEDLDAEIYPDLEEHFDTSDYPDSHYFPKLNKKVLGKFKNESPLYPIEEMVALRPKQYALRDTRGKVTMKSKGLSRQSMKDITFQDYLDVLHKEVPCVMTKMNAIKSRNHVVYTERFEKKALDGDDRKRIVLEDNIHTVPWGYFDAD